MQNEPKGEVFFKYKEKDYSFRLTFNSLVVIEMIVGESVNTVLQRFQVSNDISMGEVRAFFYAGAQQRPNGENESGYEFKDDALADRLDEAGRIIQELGVFDVQQMIADGIRVSFKRDVEETKKKQKAKSGSGKS